MCKSVFTLFFLISVHSLISQTSKIVRPTEINTENQLNINEEDINVKENLVTKTYLVKNEEYYLNFINALEVKKERVREDSLMNLKAIKENWYFKIDKELKKAKDELDLINENEK